MPSSNSAAKKRNISDVLVDSLTDGTDEEMVPLDTYRQLEDELKEAKKQLEEAQKRIKELENASKTHESSKPDDDEDLESEDDDANTSPWDTMFEQLREYRLKVGHCKVPTKSGKLGEWVKYQRRLYKNLKAGNVGKHSNISQPRINKLDSIGFCWGQSFGEPMTWEEGMKQMQEYKEAMGDCNVAISLGNPSPLAKFVSAQRNEYRMFKKGRASLLSVEQIGQLTKLGFDWKGPRLPMK